MTEADLKGALVKLARQSLSGYVVIRHEDHFTHGIPDITFTGHRRTIWIEVKHASPGFKSKGIQELTMNRLGLAGYALYVVYWEKGKEKRTYIVDPSLIGQAVETWTKFTDGFNHQWVIETIRDYQRPQ